MQGATAKHGAVVEPSANKLFARGLVYAAVSRPTELAILMLPNPLAPAHFTCFPQERHAINQENEKRSSYALWRQVILIFNKHPPRRNAPILAPKISTKYTYRILANLVYLQRKKKTHLYVCGSVVYGLRFTTVAASSRLIR